jgi:hypothetical protein
MGRLARILSVVLGLFLALLLLGGILSEVDSPEDEADRPVGSGSTTPGGTPQAPEQLGSIPTTTVTATVTMTATVTAEPQPRLTVTVTETVTVTTQQDDDGGTGEGDDSTVQTGIQFGYACSPVGALGIAEDGRPAKCFKGKDGRARWGYDSNRG